MLKQVVVISTHYREVIPSQKLTGEPYRHDNFSVKQLIQSR